MITTWQTAKPRYTSILQPGFTTIGRGGNFFIFLEPAPFPELASWEASWLPHSKITRMSSDLTPPENVEGIFPWFRRFYHGVRYQYVCFLTFSYLVRNKVANPWELSNMPRLEELMGSELFHHYKPIARSRFFTRLKRAMEMDRKQKCHQSQTS